MQLHPVDAVRYGGQLLVLSVFTPVIVVLGLAFAPLWDVVGPLGLLTIPIAIGMCYAMMALYEALDTWADGLIEEIEHYPGK